jgi:hypothetical protein
MCAVSAPRQGFEPTRSTPWATRTCAHGDKRWKWTSSGPRDLMRQLERRLVDLCLDEHVRNRGRSDDDDGIEWNALSEAERAHVRETEMILHRHRKATP